MIVNKTLRIGMIFAVIAIITLMALVMTFAKYACQGTGEDSARVAKWGLNVNIETDLGLFDPNYSGIGGKTTVDASDGSNVVAPGTSKTTDITLATFTNNEAPEVMYHFEPSLTINNDGQGPALINKLDNLPGWHWVLGRNNEGTTQYKTSSQLIEAVKAYQQQDIAPNTMPDTKTIQLGWTWEFDNSSAAGTWDASDTELGNLIASGQLSGMKATLNLNAYQCQGCSTNVDLSGKVSQTDGTAVAGANVAYNYSSAANGTISATTESDGKYSMKVPTNTKGALTITKDGYKETTTEEFSVADQPVEKNVTNFDPLTEIKVPEGIDASYNGSVQTGVASGTGYILSDPTGGASIVDGNAVATDAGVYSVKATPTTGYAWEGGSTNPMTIKWTIDKADNPMDLPNQSDTSSVVSDQSVEYTFNAATGAPEGSTVTYDASSSASSQDNFYIPNHSNNMLVCAENTGADTYTIDITATAYETTNYNKGSVTKSFTWTVNEAVSYKPIQKSFTVDTTSYTVNFLPAFSDGEAPGDFYKLDTTTNSYTKLDNSTMAKLAAAISTAGAANVYTDATNATFYGTINRSWDNTFYQATKQAEYPKSLDSAFETAIHAKNIKTMYGDYCDEDTKEWKWDHTKAEGNWNASDMSKEPDLNEVGYSSFYKAYTSSLLGGNADTPWSSRAYNSDDAYFWDVNDSGWYPRDRTWGYAAVLSQAF